MPEGLGSQHKKKSKIAWQRSFWNRKLDPDILDPVGKKVWKVFWRPQKSGSRKKIDWNLTKKLRLKIDWALKSDYKYFFLTRNLAKCHRWIQWLMNICPELEAYVWRLAKKFLKLGKGVTLRTKKSVIANAWKLTEILTRGIWRPQKSGSRKKIDWNLTKIFFLSEKTQNDPNLSSNRLKSIKSDGGCIWSLKNRKYSLSKWVLKQDLTWKLTKIWLEKWRSDKNGTFFRPFEA